jgi:ABC-2 type transport system ATP-binding protein
MQDSAEDVLLAAEGLTRYYGELCAVDGFGIQLRRGEVVGLLGPNGAGKSTTMRMLSGVLAAHAGSVRIAGTDLLEDPRAAKARLGYLPEQPPLTRELSVDEFLDFCARIHGVPRRDVRRARDETKARCGLTEVGGRLIANLSKGFQQRVGIAQAIIHQPAVVILDEPTIGLDPIQIREIRALIRALGADHSVMLSTHILPEVQTVCERVVMIHRGRVVLDAAMAELRADAGLRVGLRRPPPLASLSALPGVRQVDAIDAGRFLIQHDADPEFAPRLAAAAVQGDWGLAELSPAGATLEEVFVRLTGADTTREAAP